MMNDPKPTDSAHSHDLTTRFLLGLFFTVCCVFALVAAAVTFFGVPRGCLPEGPLEESLISPAGGKIIAAFAAVLFFWLADRIYKVWSRK